jgi:hypothetical protein
MNGSSPASTAFRARIGYSKHDDFFWITPCVPECAGGDAELRAGLCETQKCIAAIASGVAAGATADVAPGDLAADIVLGVVGVQRDLWAVEDEEEFGLIGVEASEQAVEGGEIGAALENAVEARA